MRKIKNIRKKLDDFLREESGAMSKESILKIGIAALGGIAAMSSMFPDEAYAGHTDDFETYNVLMRVNQGAEYDDYEPFEHTDHTNHDSGK
jgi:hypothetical protein